MGRRPLYFSRINEDGTPFQFSFLVGTHRPTLQFLSEAGIPGSSNLDRIMLSRKRIHTLACLLNSEKILSEVNDLLDKVAPASDPDLLAENAGAYWIGVSYSPEVKPRMKIYINCKWGSEKKMWERLDLFVSHFNGLAQWQEAKKALNSGMMPLGMALTISEHKQPSGRVYVSAYGNKIDYYERFVRSITNDREYNLFKQFTEIILGDDRQYPTKSVVCSFSFDSQDRLDFKFEMCGHCIFSSDTDASERCLNWLKTMDVDPTAYLYTIQVLSDDHLSKTNVDLHSFVGFGLKHHEIYSSLYFKPNIIR